MSKKTYEIREGVGTRGQVIYCVFVEQDGRTIWVERFATAAEAKAWIKYSC